MARLVLVDEGAPVGPRLWVELLVTAEDIRNGTDVRRPGNYLFRGMWYGDKVDDIQSYGKVIERRAYPSRVMGKASGLVTSYLRRKLD
jgi:hypothetical protein